MSSIFSRCNVITQEEHDDAIKNPPSIHHRLFPSYRPDVTTVPDDDPKNDTRDFSVLSRVVPSNNSKWLSRRSEKERVQFIHKQKVDAAIVRKVSRQVAIAPGCSVKSRHATVSDLPIMKLPKGQRRSRPYVMGKVMKRSEWEPRFWLINFNNGKTLYCTEDELIFESSVAQDQLLGRDKNNMLQLSTVKRKYDEKDIILRSILSSKVYQASSDQDISYVLLENAFKNQFPWIDEDKLRTYVSLHRFSLLPKVDPESWIARLVEVDDKSMTSPSKAETVTLTSKNIVSNNKSYKVTDSASIRMISKPKHTPKWIQDFRKSKKALYQSFSFDSDDENSVFSNSRDKKKKQNSSSK